MTCKHGLNRIEDRAAAIMIPFIMITSEIFIYDLVFSIVNYLILQRKNCYKFV